jgi:hypothetical protein
MIITKELGNNWVEDTYPEYYLTEQIIVIPKVLRPEYITVEHDPRMSQEQAPTASEKATGELFTPTPSAGT